MVSSHSRSVMVSIAASFQMPAFATRISSEPKRSTVDLTIFSTDAARETSALITSVSAPNCSHRAATREAASRSLMIVDDDAACASFGKLEAVAAPMPRDAPVIIAIFPTRLIIVTFAQSPTAAAVARSVSTRCLISSRGRK